MMSSGVGMRTPLAPLLSRTGTTSRPRKPLLLDTISTSGSSPERSAQSPKSATAVM